MSINRYAARVDGNQKAIVDALERIGAKVWCIGRPVDLLVGFRGVTVLMEIKMMTGTLNPRPEDHTPAQKRFLLDWTGGPVSTVTDIEGAIRAVTVAAA